MWLDCFEKFTRRVLKALQESGIDYVIIGGLAAIKYGRPRSTMDIDVIVKVNPKRMSHIETLIQAFTRHELKINTLDLEKSLLEGAHIPVFDKRSPYRLDLKNVHDKLDFTSFSNRRINEIFSIETWLEPPENLIVAKLVYGEQQNEEDVLAVILTQKDSLKMSYLQERAKEERVNEKLRALFEELKGQKTHIT